MLTRHHCLSKVTSFHQGCHPIKRNKWKSRTILRGKKPQQTLGLGGAKCCICELVEKAKINIHTYILYKQTLLHIFQSLLFLCFNFRTETCQWCLKMSMSLWDRRPHICEFHIGVNFSFRPDLVNQIHGSRLHGDLYFLCDQFPPLTCCCYCLTNCGKCTIFWSLIESQQVFI